MAGQNSPSAMSGFPELLPASRIVEQQILDRLREVFELHGFASLETRAVEPLAVLAKGGEIDKEIFGVHRHLAATGTDQETEALGLRFDLTVPLARFLAENASRLQFPFRRYQIQPVWRGERPQAGRYRQFTQADIDIVGAERLPFHHDLEVVQTMIAALAELPLPRVSFQFNNRLLIEGFYTGIGLPNVPAALRQIDKLGKLRPEQVAQNLVDGAGATPAQAEKCLALAQIRGTDGSFITQVEALGVSHPNLEAGLQQLSDLLTGAAAVAAGRVELEANLRVARGLDYYTGTVVECYAAGNEQLAIAAGGRYDRLVSDGRTNYPGVGISFGVSRSLVPLLSAGQLTASRSVPSAVLVAVVDEANRSLSEAVAAQLRARKIPTEVASAATKFGKQIREADRRGIPYVWFPGTGHQVKDIRSGAQVEADPAVWEPPAADLRAQIISSD